MKRLAGVVAMAALLLGRPDPVAAQPSGHRVELGVQITAVGSSQFDAADLGFGGRISWHPVRLVGIESELDFYPRDFPGGQPFSRSRTEALFGATVGPAFERVRPFGRLRAGFVRWSEAPEPYACILIYPPPLSCSLASGRTLFALDIGGGVEVFSSPRTFVRFDGGDRLLRYPGPVLDDSGSSREAAFFSHDFRFAVSGGLRF